VTIERSQIAVRAKAGFECRVVTPADIDWAIAEIAGEQHGVVSRAQLLAIGVSATAIDWRLKRGRLHRVHRGVYLVGHAAAPQRAPEMAAVLACGSRSLVSHRSAAVLWALISAPGLDYVEVTVADLGNRVRPGIRVHRTTSLDRRDLRRLDGIPVTSPARTLLDIAGIVSPQVLERAVAEGEARRLARRSQLLQTLDRNSGRPGSTPLRALLEQQGGPALTRSVAEEKLLALVRAALLPAPEANVKVGPYEVDLLWRGERVIAEVDGYRFHSSRRAFERDRRRDPELRERGYEVIRITWRQIVDEPEVVIARIAGALARASASS